jgi:hypothetical protein
MTSRILRNPAALGASVGIGREEVGMDERAAFIDHGRIL